MAIILSDITNHTIKEAYPEVYGNSDSSKKIIVLNEGVDFEAISSTAAELQMNENKKVNSVEICKLFGFPHTIIDGGASESDKREFVAVVIDFLNLIETELDRCLLLEDEKQDGYYWAFDTKELTRGSILERYQAYEIAIRNRFLQVDEVRQAEDYDPIGFNFVTLGLGDVLLNPQTLEVFTPNTGQSKNPLTGESRDYDLMELRYNHNNDSKGRFASGGSGSGSKSSLTKSTKSGIINTNDVKSVGISSIDSPIEQKHTGKGNPNAINTFGAELNNRQKQLLEQLPEFDSRAIVPKNSVNMTDLSALTAETGHEFAMFTKNGKRLVIRGNESMVNIDVESAIKLAKNGYKWSGHTHPGMDFNCLIASAGDKTILECFNQKTSVIYNSKGNFLTFERE